MRYSKMLLPTSKEVPAEAEVISHQLLLRGGFIRKLTAGVYSYLPLGLMALRKVTAIVREEMKRAGAQEILMPMVQPGDLWMESGRWQHYGPELLRFRDRNERECYRRIDHLRQRGEAIGFVEIENASAFAVLGQQTVAVPVVARPAWSSLAWALPA